MNASSVIQYAENTISVIINCLNLSVVIRRITSKTSQQVSYRSKV